MKIESEIKIVTVQKTVRKFNIQVTEAELESMFIMIAHTPPITAYEKHKTHYDPNITEDVHANISWRIYNDMKRALRLD